MSRPTLATTLVACCFLVSGCGKEAVADKTNGSAGIGSGKTAGVGASTPPMTLAQGPDVCFRAIAKRLPAGARVSTIMSLFSAGHDISDTDRAPKGQITTCSVQYQDPRNSQKLLGVMLDPASGTFTQPGPVNIQEVGGNPEAFRLNDYLIPVEKVDVSRVASIMAAQEPAIRKVYSKFAWTGVRLVPPTEPGQTNMLRLDLAGRLASNDVEHEGFITITPDGSRVIDSSLTP